jgi:2,3-bisphosphoglycerate-dependent phosphoglycerate mutase
MSYLVLVRHGESEWNAKGLWTGWTDIGIDEKGKQEARETAKLIKDINFEAVFCSPLKRCRETLEVIEKELGFANVPTAFSDAIKERNYGDFTGKNKWEIEKQVGAEEFTKIRRSWDHPLPNGESLKDVYGRAVPFYEAEIKPKLMQGENILVVAHGNSIRSLLKHLENLTDEQITGIEVGIAQAIVFKIDENGKIVGKEIRGGAKDVPHEHQ